MPMLANWIRRWAVERRVNRNLKAYVTLGPARPFYLSKVIVASDENLR